MQTIVEMFISLKSMQAEYTSRSKDNYYDRVVSDLEEYDKLNPFEFKSDFDVK
jgi:hypothetical protein